MKTLGYYNGKYDEIENMVIPMNDRVHWYGDGVYDAGPCHNYHIFAIDEHIDRFFNSAALMDIKMPVTKGELKDLLTELVKKVDTGDLFVYYQVTRGGYTNRLHSFDESIPANLWVTLTHAEIGDGKTPIKCITEPDTRFYHCNVKTLNLMPSVIAAQHAKRAGAQETILYRKNMGNRVTECAHSNCHIILDGKLYTAPTDELILPGIARAHLIRMAKKLGYAVSETPYDLDTLRGADEILVTSSSKLCMHVNELDEKPVGGKNQAMVEDLRSHLIDEFFEATE
ncbi:MAG: aminotransferase class IV [Lachnospiraceae bacterium]|jgi:D-alanine transaminase|nr:aminotransferase class IV [Lachnospiraceae bacterium]MCH4027792.1 aminotransferase class IV [Lachnospiraceae bacterium]MCH4065634.1 aminotransferase class IV [Lachnospiraceae bacterium]MCH4111672.1 aminotransferase class IV [Lachnospiraceae bacterium]MCI1353378.1 aminotransferase class IV [Lachnospiraceae bacterium]